MVVGDDPGNPLVAVTVDQLINAVGLELCVVAAEVGAGGGAESWCGQGGVGGDGRDEGAACGVVRTGTGVGGDVLVE